MNALISGQVGIAIFVNGNTTTCVKIDSQQIEIPIPYRSIPYLLADATDIAEFKSIKKEAALKLLDLKWQQDRALHLFLILLDNCEEFETRNLAVECLTELFQDIKVSEFVLNRLYSTPLPYAIDFKEINLVSSHFEAITKPLSELEDKQILIKQYRKAWNTLPKELFKNFEIKQEFEECLINNGTFRRFVISENNTKLFNNALVQCYQDLAHLPNSRAVIKAWLGDIKKLHKHTDICPIMDESLSASTKNDRHYNRNRKMTAREAFENVNKQKQAILLLLKENNLIGLRKYVEQLIKTQIDNGGPEFAAKSLCDLSQAAKNIKNHSLQLELAQKATDIAPDDGWSLVQVADAFIDLKRYDDALTYFKRAENCGELAIARTGIARIKAAQGKLEEALDDFRKHIDDFGEDVVTMINLAEVLRQMWQLDDALQAYDSAIQSFPDEVVPYNGRAAVLKDLGRHEDALKAYDEAINRFGENVVSCSGRAEVLKEIGQHEDALKAYEKNILMFPDDHVARCGRADVLKTMGEYNDALKAYEQIIVDYPYISVPWSGKSEVLKSLSRFEEALETYDNAIINFPNNEVLLNGRANVLKAQGKFEDALKAYDSNLREFPYNIFTLSARADLLKELGYYEDALAAYDKIILKTNNKIGAKHAKAAIFVLMGKFDEAEQLLPTTPPKTRDEWIAHHIRGMIFLKKGDIEKAINLFNSGLQGIPFFKDRQFFKNALTIAHLYLKHFKEIPKYINEGHGHLNNILRIHAFGALGEINNSQDAYHLTKDNCPSNIIPLRDELVARYLNIPAEPQHSEKWLFEEECKHILLSAA